MIHIADENENQNNQNSHISLPISSKLGSNLNQEDCKWIKECDGRQTSGIKYPTFDDNLMDDQLKNDVTYETLMEDFKSVNNDIIPYFQHTYKKFIIDNPFNIIANFKLYELSYPKFFVFSFVLKRQLDLMSYLIKIKFENSQPEGNSINAYSDQAIDEIIKKEYLNSSVDEIILLIFSDEAFKKVVDNDVDIPTGNDGDKYHQFKTIVEKGLEDEKCLLSIKDAPSICGIDIALKYMKIILERCIVSMQKLTNEIQEVPMIEYFQDVYKNL
jgi:hypothetical protein